MTLITNRAKRLFRTAIFLTALAPCGLTLAQEEAVGDEAPQEEAVASKAATPASSTPRTPSAPTEEALPQAKSVDLRDPVPEPEALIPAPEPSAEQSVKVAGTSKNESAPESEVPPLVLLGTEVPPLTATRLAWSPAHSFEGLSSPTPVLVVHGAKPGPQLCLTAAIHGDEVNGIEIVRRVLYDLDPATLRGSVIGVPIVNMQGFQRSSRYLPDRRDLNRYFPGSAEGSSAARIAYSFFHEVIAHCTVLVDLHTGSFDRTNLPQLRADLTQPSVLEIAQGFGATVVLHNEGALGTLRRAAVEAGIPAVTVEAGGPMRLQQDAVKHSVKGIRTLLHHLGMVKKSRIWGEPEPAYYSASWIRADIGGILRSEVELGERVKKDELLGVVTNPITNISTKIVSPIEGRILGMALDQVVMPGYAAYHIGFSADARSISENLEKQVELTEGASDPSAQDMDLRQAPLAPTRATDEVQPLDELLESD